MSCYAAVSSSEQVTKGKISLLQEGKDFCLKQIAAGLKAFASALSNELHSFRELAVNSEDDVAAELEEENDLADDSECDEDEADEEFSGGEHDEEGADSTPGDNELTEFSKIVNELHAFPPLRSERISEDICSWYFPQEISQSTFNGRNGSNACSLISVLLACLFVRKNMQIPDEGFLPNNVIQILCGCMELGNRMYDMCRDSLPNRYLSVEEAVSLLSFTNISVEEPLPVRMEDEHELSTLCRQLGRLSENRNCFVNIIVNEKTSLFVVTPTNIMYIDTHLHGSSGAVIVKGCTSNLSEFCKSVWALEAHDKSTFAILNVLMFA